jgi:hypothetical protein
MINRSNYDKIISEFGIENLNPVLKAEHENYLSIQEFYDDDKDIRETVDIYLKAVEKFIRKFQAEQSETRPKKKSANEGASKSESKKFKTKIKKKPLNTKVKPTQRPKGINANAKNVEHIREEIKFIRRYIRLHNKEKPAYSILSLIKSLQRSIIQKLIRKTSPYAAEIRLIQDKLVKAYNNAKGHDIKLGIKEDELSKLVSIAGGEEVYPSINIMKRYVGMQGKAFDPKKIESFIRHIESVIKKKKVRSDDPYHDKVKVILKSIKKLKGGNFVQLSQSELNGLEGIVNACSCKHGLGKIYKTRGPLRKCKKGTYTDSDEQGACSHNKGLSGVLTAEEMANRQLDLLDFFSFWLSLFGKPANNFTLMIHGEPHNGKTIFLLKLAQYLANNFGDVLYVSSEEFASPTMTKKVSEFLNPLPDRLHFAENLTDPDLSQYNFVILDSVNDLGLRINDFKELRKEHPDTAFIFILQHTKSGNFRGGKDWEHLAEIVGEVEKGVISITKNRYAPKTSIDFFSQIGLQWEELVNHA